MSIVITGSPGVGKHTISDMVSGGRRIVDINAVASNEGLVEEDQVDTDALGDLLGSMVEEGDMVVGHLAPYVMDGELVSVAVVLRRSPYELEKVYSDRGYARQKTLDNLGSEILGVVAADAYGAFGDKMREIDATGKSLSQVAGQTRKAIAGSDEREPVDWLGIVASRGDLGRFFADSGTRPATD